MAKIETIIVSGVECTLADVALRAQVSGLNAENRLTALETGLDSSMADMREAISVKGGEISEDTPLTQFAAAITSIPEGVDTSDATAVAADIREGKTAYINGQKVTGTIYNATNDVAVTVNEVEVPAGLYTETRTYKVGTAVEGGYYIPGVDDQYIGSGTFLTSPATIAGSVWLSPENIKKGVTIFNVTGSYGGESTDLSFVTATASDILAGKTGVDSNGNPVYGMIPDQTGTQQIVGNHVEILAGFHRNTTFTVGTAKGAEVFIPSTADKTIAANTYLTEVQTIKGDANLVADNIAEGVSIFGVAGTHKGGSGGGTMDFYKCAAVYGPYKVTRIRVSGAGTMAVNGDYELTDLKTGTNEEVWKLIGGNHYLYRMNGYSFGIDSDYTKEPYQALYYTEIYSENPDPTSGSWYTGYNYNEDKPTGTAPAPTVTKIQVTLDGDVPKTWDGYKAVLTDGVYSFEKTLTTGMSYGEAFTPSRGRIYNAECTVEINRLDIGLPDDLIFYAPLESDTTMAETGQALTYKGSPEVTEKDGIPCMYFNGSSNMYFPDAGFPSGKQPFTLCAMVNPSDVDGGWRCFFGWGSRGGSQTAMLLCNRNGNTLGISFYADESSMYPPPDGFGKWVHLAAVYDGQTINVYFNGTLAGSRSKDTDIRLSRGSIGCNTGDGEYFIGYLADCRIYNRALTESEIKEISNKFFGGDSGADEPDNGGDTGGSGDKSYSYTVRSAGTAAANGDYWESEEKLSNALGMQMTTYTNGSCSLFQDPGNSFWYICNGTSVTDVLYRCDSGVSGNWETVNGTSPAPTVTEYSADSGNGGGGGDTIRVSGCSDSGFNGDYALSTYTTDSGGPVYLQTNGDKCLYHLQDYWWLSNTYVAFPGSYYCYDNHDANTPPISTAWYTSSEEPVSGMKTELVSGGDSGDSGDSSDKVYCYTVSGCSNADVNGDYYLTDQTYNDKPVYSNGKVYLFTHYMSDIGCDYVCFGTTLEFDGLFYIAASTIPIGSELWTSTSDYREYPITIAEYANVPGGAGGKTYVYKVSGAGTAGVNGDYWESEEKITNGLGTQITAYTNGSYSLYHDPDNDFWYIVEGASAFSSMYMCGSSEVVGNTQDWFEHNGAQPYPLVEAY